MRIIEYIKNKIQRILEFFRQQVQIARIFGIPVRIDYRWFVVLILMSWLTAMYIPSSMVDDILAKLAIGFVATIIFFVSIYIHELGHCLVARMEGVEVRDIVLHPFGGLARFHRAPDTPRAEFRIAIAGPATSFLLALIFLALTGIFNSFDSKALTPMLFLLFFWNLLLAVFNLFPGYPLDGGRVLRAYLWKRGKDLNEATILTGRAGQVIAGALMIVGSIITIGRSDITGLWTVLIGFFLYDAAKGIIEQTNEAEMTLVGEVMSLPFPLLPEDNVLNFIDNILPIKRLTTFLVAKDKQLYGVLLLEDLKNLERGKWHKTKIQEIMRPISPDYFVETNTLLTDARNLMKHNGIGAVGVIDGNGELVGYLQKGKIRRVK